MPTLPLREYFWLAIILILAAAFVWDHYSGVQQGVAKQVAADARVAQAAIKAAEVQKQADLKTSSDAVAGLKDELQKLKDHPPIPVPVAMRLCVSSARRSLSAPPQLANRAPSPAPASGELPSVPAGAGAGIDIGPGVQRVAEAADVVAARDRACLTWARGISK